MAFKLGDIIVDRIHSGVAEDFDGNLLYLLTQLADGTIDITAESKDAVDKDGTLVKRFYNAKTGTFAANNAMINVNVIGAKSGSNPEIASEENPIVMPKTITVKAGSTVKLDNFVEGTVKVKAMDVNGTLGEAYTLDAAASASAFAIAEDGTLTLPSAADVVQYFVKYQRTVKAGVAVRNRADKFPETIRLTLKVLAVDPCQADTLKAAYIEFPSFQPSPELSISLTTDAQLEYSGDLQVNYCSLDKELFSFYWADEDEEE